MRHFYMKTPLKSKPRWLDNNGVFVIDSVFKLFFKIAFSYIFKLDTKLENQIANVLPKHAGSKLSSYGSNNIKTI